MNRFIYIVLSSCLVLLLPACGHKGKLYLPDETHPHTKPQKGLLNPIPGK